MAHPAAPQDLVDLPMSAPAHSQPSTPPTDHIPVVHEAPRMAPTVFPSWDAFTAAFAAYQQRTFQVYFCVTSTSVATRNRRMTKNCDQNIGFIPSELKFYSKTMTCTHGGKRRTHDQGIRKKRTPRLIQCSARLNVLTKKKTGGDSSKASGWQVVVTQHTAIHNHPLDAKTYMSYPRNRWVQDPMVLEAVDALRKAGVKQDQIRKYIVEKAPDKQVTRSDVKNLLTRMKDGSFMTSVQRSGSSTVNYTPTPAASESEDESVDTGESYHVAEEERWSNVASAALGEVTEVGATHPVFRADTAEPISAGFRLRVSSSGRQRLPEAEQSSSSQRNDVTSLHDLCDSDEFDSRSFKLRVQCLEAQNLALYTQNRRLVQQNRQNIADLTDAQTKANDAQTQLIALKNSEITFTETVGALSLEVARLKEESARWKHMARQTNVNVLPDTPGPRTALVGGNHIVDGHDGGSREAIQVSKRRLHCRDSDGEYEHVRPQKRVSHREKSESSDDSGVP